MKISLNWIQEYTNTTSPPELLADKLTDLGLECTVEVSPLSFKDVVFGYVKECNPHPDSDHLSVCVVDIGDGEDYTIVCGAPNVRQGINVPVAKVGATLGSGSFKIKKSKLRGVKSNGMICSGKELGFSDDHEGIIILNAAADLGTPIEQVLDFGQDAVFDLELTPNRGDCLSHKGAAREVAIAENSEMIYRSLNLVESDSNVNDFIKIRIDNPEGCPRYAARVITGVKVGPSPEWLVNRLTAIGQKSINNVVDAANYVLMDSGHPMHTFDLNEIKSGEIGVRFADKGEKITLLDEVERELEDFHLLICDGKKPVALAGIMGGLNSGITEDTTDILLESAYFTPVVVRKGAKSLDISTDASRRFERDTDIDNVIFALDQLAALIVEIAGGEVKSGIVDNYPAPKKKNQVIFTADRCNALLGTELSMEDMRLIFQKLEIEFTENSGKFDCIIPYWRNDLEREVDLIEEIARVYGYNNLPVSSNFEGSYLAFIPDEHHLDGKIRNILSARGYNEHVANSLVSKSETELFSDREPVAITNPISSEMGYLRNSLSAGLLKAVSHNEKRRETYFRLFEFGAVHQVNHESETKTRETFKLGMAWYGISNQHWRTARDWDIFSVKGECDYLLNLLGCKRLRYMTESENGFDLCIAVYSGKVKLGIFGIPSSAAQKYYDLKGSIFVFEGELDNLRLAGTKNLQKYQLSSPYPAIQRDVNILVQKSISVEEISRSIKSSGGDLLQEILLTDIYESEELGGDKRSLLFSLTFQSLQKNLQSSVVDKFMEKIVGNLVKHHQAVQR